MHIRKAELGDIETIVPLFNAYRMFYKQEVASERAGTFLLENVKRERSIIFIAHDDLGRPGGFIQFYLRISSLSMAPYIYIADLFVDPAFRRQGIARKLMQKAAEYGRAVGARSVQLETAHTNKEAQGLYESLGYEHEQEYRTYCLSLLQDQSNHFVPEPSVRKLENQKKP